MFPPFLLSQVFRKHIIQGLMLKVLISFESFFVRVKKAMFFLIPGHIAHQPFLLATVFPWRKRGM